MPNITNLSINAKDWKKVIALAKKNPQAKNLNVELLTYRNIMQLALGLKPTFWIINHKTTIKHRTRDALRAKV